MTTASSIKKLALLAALTLGAWTSAQAVNVVNTIGLTGSVATGYSAGLSDPAGTEVNHTVSGAFTDTFTFSFTGGSTIDVWLNTVAESSKLATQQIIFTSATINGQSLSIDPIQTSGSGKNMTQYGSAGLFEVPADGNLVLVINGYAGLMGSEGNPISASYSGGINVMPSAVPEPETYALLLAGLGAIGFVARRRSMR